MLRLAEKAALTTIDEIEGPETLAKRRLIAAGEHLFGRNGIASTPLHKIAALVGQSNRYAVQYHFGERQGLVDAIHAIRRRRPIVRRRELYEIAKAEGLLDDITALLEIIFLPTAEQVDDRGEHSYARFLLQFLSRIDFDPVVEDPFKTSGDIKPEMVARIAELAGTPFPLMEWRCYQQHFAMLAALGSRDNPHFPSRGQLSLETLVAETIATIAPAMVAPVNDPEAIYPVLPTYTFIPID